MTSQLPLWVGMNLDFWDSGLLQARVGLHGVEGISTLAQLEVLCCFIVLFQTLFYSPPPPIYIYSLLSSIFEMLELVHICRQDAAECFVNMTDTGTYYLHVISI